MVSDLPPSQEACDPAELWSQRRRGALRGSPQWEGPRGELGGGGSVYVSAHKAPGVTPTCGPGPLYERLLGSDRSMPFIKHLPALKEPTV